MKVLLREKGQASLEYVGAIVAAALVVVAIVLLAPGLGQKMSDGIEQAVCEIVGDCPPDDSSDAGGDAPVAVDPELTPDQRDDLTSADPQDAQDVLGELSPEELAWLEQNDPDAYAAAVAARSWAEERELVDQYATGDLGDFLEYKESGIDPRLDPSDDGCSNVPDSSFLFDFTDACVRHDFAYRNYKDLGLFDEEKQNADGQFLQDMKDHCATRSVFKRPGCYAAAETYYQGVQELGGKNCGPVAPGRIPGPCAPEYG